MILQSKLDIWTNDITERKDNMKRNPEAEAAACSRKKEGWSPARAGINKEIGKGDWTKARGGHSTNMTSCCKGSMATVRGHETKRKRHTLTHVSMVTAATLNRKTGRGSSQNPFHRQWWIRMRSWELGEEDDYFKEQRGRTREDRAEWQRKVSSTECGKSVGRSEPTGRSMGDNHVGNDWTSSRIGFLILDFLSLIVPSTQVSW